MNRGIDLVVSGDSWALVVQVVVKYSTVKSIGDTVARKNLRCLRRAERSLIPDWQQLGFFTIIY
ncbi:hypothetical protein LC605_00975 [Nostoc sp. CHAB 5836]|uniref:hypothetical protein n=1 Tax=Nostoc sp. CHAB 5836 TaxID=2780404 RepID=UPI001E5AD7E1|nr:hypothetical protein [Nostoc sp. CHAB 5836]MCC5613674.1 hypothetical protein [Nostoc sp. CHAB 5836]